MISKNKIMDSFEEFVALPLSVLKNRIIQITGFKSDFILSKSISLELTDDTVHINCVNSEGAYNLLSSVIYKRKLKKQQELMTKKEQMKNSSSPTLLISSKIETANEQKEETKALCEKIEVKNED